MNTPIKDHIKSRKFKSFDQLDEWIDTMIKKSRRASGIYIMCERKPL